MNHFQQKYVVFQHSFTTIDSFPEEQDCFSGFLWWSLHSCSDRCVTKPITAKRVNTHIAWWLPFPLVSLARLDRDKQPTPTSTHKQQSTLVLVFVAPTNNLHPSSFVPTNNLYPTTLSSLAFGEVMTWGDVRSAFPPEESCPLYQIQSQPPQSNSKQTANKLQTTTNKLIRL